MKLRDIDGNPVSLEMIPNLLDKDKEYQIFIGTDSKIIRSEKKVKYATCIVLYKKGNGGKVLVAKEKAPIPSSLKERLSHEVWRSLELCMELNKVLPNIETVIHIDVNKSNKHKSGKYYQELVSLVVAQGFKCQVKPDAFAAQTIADRLSKTDNRI